jgi:hypothetical protein
MRSTMILHAHPDKFIFLSKEMQRFSGTRSGFLDRLYAAWLVFSGRADALSWEEWERHYREQYYREQHLSSLPPLTNHPG